MVGVCEADVQTSLDEHMGDWVTHHPGSLLCPSMLSLNPVTESLSSEG
jgi:hypothetical protein